MAAAEATSSTETTSLFTKKYDEFVDDLLAALPECKTELLAARTLSDSDKRARFHAEVSAVGEFHRQQTPNVQLNPGTVLPGVTITDALWGSFGDDMKEAIWDHLRVVSICMFLDEFGGSEQPIWMEDAMKELKHKFESTDFSALMEKFASFFKSATTGDGKEAASGDAAAGPSGLPNIEKLFESGFPKMPEKFLKGHLAKLAQEIVKEIKPEDLGITKEMISECEKDPSRAFNILFSTFMNDPGVIQRVIGRIGNRLQQKVISGAIRPMEIAREAEEMMKEFTDNKPFVEMMESIKTAFGFEDMEMARKVGKEGSARLSAARARLRKKLDKMHAANAAAATPATASTTASATASSKSQKGKK
jgi:hypothetical protein